MRGRVRIMSGKSRKSKGKEEEKHEERRSKLGGRNIKTGKE